MPRPLPRERWLAETAERFAALEAWRQAHPPATWAEIEAAVDAQLGPLRAQLVGETAMASEATALAGPPRVCPQCGARLQAAGTRRRQVRSDQDEPIALARTYARCPQ